MNLISTRETVNAVKKAEAAFGPLNTEYQKKMDKVIKQALAEYPRLLAIRVDFRLPDLDDPDHHARTDSSVITRLFKSLKERLESDQKNKAKTGMRVHSCHLRYIWVREFNRYGKKHYHVLLLLNKDAYYHPGDFEKDDDTLASMISAAWLSALGLEYPQYKYLTHFPIRGYYWIDTKGERHLTTLDALYFRTSYMAKQATKSNEDGERNFGCSQK